MKILFYDTQSYDRESFDRTKEQFPEIEVEYLKTGLAARTASLAKGYDAVCAFVNSDVGTKTVEALHEAGVKLILMRCAGFNNVDLKTAAKYGIDVRRVPGYSPEAVAEHAMTLAMTVNRHMHKAYTKVRENDFSLGGLMGFNFYQKTAGIVGTGKIGAQVIRSLSGFGCRILAVDPYEKEEVKKYATYVDRETVYREADIITLHLPLTPENYHMLDRETIAKMKDGVILINCARGELVDIDALVEGIESEKIGALGLDTVEGEEGIIHEDHRIDVAHLRTDTYGDIRSLEFGSFELQRIFARRNIFENEVTLRIRNRCRTARRHRNLHVAECNASRTRNDPALDTAVLSKGGQRHKRQH